MIIPGHFDNPPSGAITAEQVREWPRCDCSMGTRLSGDCVCREARYQDTLTGLLTHPGVSSSARAVIEEALK